MFVGPFTFDSRSVSRLFDKQINLIVLKEVLLKQQRLLSTFNFIIIPPATKLLGNKRYTGFIMSVRPSVDKSYVVR
jgi:hypothetical protein